MELEALDWKDQTVGVTGAGGFIGLRTLERLAETGARLRGLDLSPQGAREAEKTGATVLVGDTRDSEKVGEFCADCDTVVHAAAIVGEGGDLERYRDVNVEGTRSVLEAASATDVSRFVHLSSVMVYGFHFPPEADEDAPLRGENNPYCQTKIESDRLAQSMHGSNLDVLVVRPGDVYGPRCQPWVVRPIELMRQRLFALPNGGRGKLDPTYVDNLIDAIAVLLEDDRTGEVFNVTDGRTLTAKEFFSYHAEMLGGRWIPTAPAWLLKSAFTATAALFRALGSEPPASPDAIHFLDKPHGYSNRKLLEAGHEPNVDLDIGMERIEQWARHSGLLD